MEASKGTVIVAEGWESHIRAVDYLNIHPRFIINSWQQLEIQAWIGTISPRASGKHVEIGNGCQWSC